MLRLLRPAEAAARRLIVVMARGVVAALPPPRPKARGRQTSPAILRGRIGTGIVLPRFAADAAAGPARASAATPAALRRLAFPLSDPLRRPGPCRRPTPVSAVPRISFPGCTTPSAIAPRRAPEPFDRLDATRLFSRIAVLAGALDDLPAQARRLARWNARRDAARDAGRQHRIAPLRGGRIFGSRGRHDVRRRPHEIDDVLADLHHFALEALRHADTS